jgi:transposase
MRGADAMQEALFSFCKLEDFVPSDHPLRPIRTLVDQSLKRLDGLFNTIYADSGRASIAPEKLIRALLLQVFYSVRSERQLMEQIRYNLLFRWFVGLAIDDSVWDHSVFSKNRDRLIEHEVVEAFFAEVMTLADKADLLSKEHFSVDGTLIQAWASHKSFKPARGQRRRSGSRRVGTQRPSRLEGQAAQQRHPCQHHRSGRAAVSQEQEHGGRAGLPGPCADGEPLRAHRWSHGHAG